MYTPNTPPERPLRVLVIANLPPFVLGGAENQVARLIEAWVGLGHHVEVAGHRIPDGRIDLGTARVATHRIAVVDSLGRGGRAASYFVSLARLIARIHTKFDVIYCRGLGAGAVSVCPLKALGRLKLPLVACPINARGVGDAHFIRSVPGWRWLVEIINRQCNAINIIAPAIETDLAEIGIFTPRLSHIPNGIPIAPPVARHAVPDVRRIIWTGRLSRQKGLDLLLPALARVAATGPAFHLEIVGDGPELPALAALCQKLGLEKHVTFTGAVGRDAIRARLAAADVFVLPSRYEGMSNAGLEAMEAGLPLLLTRCGGIDTYVGPEIGWVCELDDVNALHEQLLHMLQTPDARLLAMGRHARAFVEREFEMHAIARRNAELLADVIRRQRVG